MAGEIRQYGAAPPLPPDESYWEALLHEDDGAADGGTYAHPQGAWDDPVLAAEAARVRGPASTRADWEQVQRVFRDDTTVELRVVGYNRGGLLVEWNSLRGFVPASQLVDQTSGTDTQDRRQALSARVGQLIRVRVIEMEPAQNRLILSERAAQVVPGTRATILNTMQPGDVCSGRVTNLCDFGVFVDLGGVEGLVHISELSWGRVGHPSDVLKIGQTVRVYVMHVDRLQERVALSIKRLHPDPWQTVEQQYQVGQLVEGVVTNVVDFGAFVCIQEGLEGLIHVSELAEGHFLHPRNVVQEGQVVRARILNIDGRGRRLGLSLRR